jgi:CheY-like chemotaxis protein
MDLSIARRLRVAARSDLRMQRSSARSAAVALTQPGHSHARLAAPLYPGAYPGQPQRARWSSEQSKGHLNLYSEAGKGTTVKIYLLRLYGTAEVLPVEPSRHALLSGASTEIVLVVEDEPRIREIATEALGELGYGVFHASSAASALQCLQSHRDIALLFTDIVMPDMNGRQLADEALKLHPNLRVLFTTGYTRNAVVHNGVLDPGLNFLSKPYTLDQLARKIHEVLS